MADVVVSPQHAAGAAGRVPADKAPATPAPVSTGPGGLALALPRVAGALGVLSLLALIVFPVLVVTPDGGVAGSVGSLHVISALLLVVAGVGTVYLARASGALAATLLVASSSLIAWRLIEALALTEVGAVFWLQAIGAWLLAWAAVEQLAALTPRWRPLAALIGVLVPLLFGAWLLLWWEWLTRGLGVPQVLLPPPSQIAERFVNSTSILAADFEQTFLKAVLIGWTIGCTAGFLIAIAIDRSPFLKRGLLPIGNLASALPIVGLAPIMVMWFGFDWPSKAAVVVVMTFFPMLVNTVAGLNAASAMQRDLMKTYAADYTQTLLKLRLPEALPFVFNALKINSTLALIGAIVAEFFGTPTVGMGFRISTEVGRMNVDMVWAEIAVAAVAGSLFYGLLALIERATTAWHPSMRARSAG